MTQSLQFAMNPKRQPLLAGNLHYRMKYFLYARKSTDTEDKQMASIEDQIAEMERLAHDLNLEVIDTISEAKSAKEPGRKGFNDMLRRIQKGEAQGILCWKLNRLARNPIDGGQISWLLQQNTIKHIQTYGRDYKSHDNVLMMQVEFGMANQFIVDLREDVKRGMRRKAERGWYPKNLPPGYVHAPKHERVPGRKENMPHPKEFELVRQLWKQFLTGKYSVIDMKKKGDSLGLCHKSGKPYSKNAYYNLFANEFYAGYFLWKDKHGNMVRYKGKHKPMITPIEFEAAQQILGRKDYSKVHTHSYPYRGLITCGECDGHVTAERKLQAICTNCKYKFSIISQITCSKCGMELSKMNNPTIIKKVYYYCAGNTKPCSQKRVSVTQEHIEDRIKSELKKIEIHKDFHAWGLQQIKKLNADPSNENTKLLSQLRKRETELSQRIDGLIRMRADGEISVEELGSLKNQTTEELRVVQAQIEREKNSKDYLDQAVTDYFDFALNASKDFQGRDCSEKKAIATKLASNLKIRDKKLYISTDEVYSKIQECAVVYHRKMKEIEPEKGLIQSTYLADYLMSFPDVCARLEDIRTCVMSTRSSKDITNSSIKNISTSIPNENHEAS